MASGRPNVACRVSFVACGKASIVCGLPQAEHSDRVSCTQRLQGSQLAHGALQVRAANLAEKERTLALAEADLAEKERTLALAEADHQMARAKTSEFYTTVLTLDSVVTQTEAIVKAEKLRLDRMEAELHAREQALAAREEEVTAREEAVTAREAEVQCKRPRRSEMRRMRPHDMMMCCLRKACP